VGSRRSCEEIRVDLSAQLDGELEENATLSVREHLETCAACRRHQAELTQVRSALRLQVIDVPVPDFTSRVLAELRAGGRRARPRSLWTGRFRVAAVAATVSAVVFIGVRLPYTDHPAQSASASELVREVRAAARSINAYQAHFMIIERGWHPLVPVRRFSASVAFDAPERLKLSVRDLTLYPDPTAWPANDIDLVANEKGWWLREPSACPSRSLPGCENPKPSVEQRSVVGRQPFDGATALLTDIVLPLETVADARGLKIVDQETVAGREALRVMLPYRRAAPLIASLQPGGSWRTFHPFDVVDLWIDAQTWVPLRFEVSAGRTGDRLLWATRLGYNDDPGQRLLSVKATSFEEREIIPSSPFDPPVSGIVTRGGFKGRDFAAMGLPNAPRYVAGLSPYRAGVTASGQKLLAYADGMTWLKVARDHEAPSRLVFTAEQVRLSDDGVVYYRPGTESFRRIVDLYVAGVHQQVESNLPRSVLLEVAASLPGAGERLPSVLRASGGVRLRRLDNTLARPVPYALVPSFMPPDYQRRAAILSVTQGGGSTLSAYYRASESEFDGFGIRLVQSRPAEMLPPSSAQYLTVAIGDGVGRWSSERGELEWVAGGVYRSVAAPSFGLPVALAIAEGLR
jgi:hypothetical protein